MYFHTICVAALLWRIQTFTLVCQYFTFIRKHLYCPLGWNFCKWWEGHSIVRENTGHQCVGSCVHWQWCAVLDQSWWRGNTPRIAGLWLYCNHWCNGFIPIGFSNFCCRETMILFFLLIPEWPEIILLAFCIRFQAFEMLSFFRDFSN